MYRIDPKTHLVDVVADKFVKPNGLAFSHDEKRLYVTDSGYATGYVNPTSMHPQAAQRFLGVFILAVMALFINV